MSASGRSEKPKSQNKTRARDLGIPFDGAPGPLNAITDVDGVAVGHTTLVSGEGKLKVGKVDIDQAPKLAAKYSVTSVPTVIVFESGEKKASMIGVAKRDKLVALAGLA